MRCPLGLLAAFEQSKLSGFFEAAGYKHTGGGTDELSRGKREVRAALALGSPGCSFLRYGHVGFLS
jgi:hypothetical protein